MELLVAVVGIKLEAGNGGLVENGISKHDICFVQVRGKQSLVCQSVRYLHKFAKFQVEQLANVGKFQVPDGFTTKLGGR
jgi:hypothetical protein